MFIAMGLSAVFPVLNALYLSGIHKINQKIGLTWLVLQGFLYILGAAVYAVRVDLSMRRWCLKLTILWPV